MTNNPVIILYDIFNPKIYIVNKYVLQFAILPYQLLEQHHHKAKMYCLDTTRSLTLLSVFRIIIQILSRLTT